MDGTQDKVTDSGSEMSLEQMFLRYHRPLLRFLQRRGRSQEDAADIAQDAYAKLAGTRPGHIQAPGPFLFTTALNILRDRLSSRAGRQADMALPIEEMSLAAPTPGADQHIAGKQEIAILKQALLELPANCRAVFVLYRYENIPQKEIADRLGISVSMVEKHVRRALLHCRTRVEEATREPLARRAP